MGKKKATGLAAFLLGAVLMIAGACILYTVRGVLEYVLPAPVATKEGDELLDLYKEGQEQMQSMGDSLGAWGIGARRQGANVYAAGGQGVEVTLYAVGEGYFDAVHETLLDGRFVTATDITRAERMIVLDERAALALYAGDDALGREVTLDGQTYEVAGVFKGGRRLGEVNAYCAYIPISAAGEDAMQMQTVHLIAGAQNPTSAGLLMRDTLSSWKAGGSFYGYDKLTLGAVMPLRWALLFVGVAVLLALLARVNALAWRRVCHFSRLLQTRYARDLFPSMAASTLMCLALYALLAAAAFLLARFSIEPLYVFTEWVPEVVVEFNSLASRFWALNDANAAAVRYMSARACALELGQGLFRWGFAATLLGWALHGVPFLTKRVETSRMERER